MPPEKLKAGRMPAPDIRPVVLDLVRLYILRRSAAAPVTSAAVAEDLAGLGLAVGANSVAQVMRGLRRKGYLACADGARSYCATRSGRHAAGASRARLRKSYGILYAERGSLPA